MLQAAIHARVYLLPVTTSPDDTLYYDFLLCSELYSEDCVKMLSRFCYVYIIGCNSTNYRATKLNMLSTYLEYGGLCQR